MAFRPISAERASEERRGPPMQNTRIFFLWSTETGGFLAAYARRHHPPRREAARRARGQPASARVDRLILQGRIDLTRFAELYIFAILRAATRTRRLCCMQFLSEGIAERAAAV